MPIDNKGSREKIEECSGDECKLHEFSCREDNAEELTLYNCNLGCNNGACRKPISQIKNNKNELMEGNLVLQIYRKENDNWKLDKTVFSGKIEIKPSKVYYLANVWNSDIYLGFGNYKVFAKLSEIKLGGKPQRDILESEWEFKTEYKEIELDASLDIATQKDEYYVGDKVKLTGENNL